MKCRGCGKILPMHAFSKYNQGLENPCCKICKKKYDRISYLRNIEKRKNSVKEYRNKNKDKIERKAYKTRLRNKDKKKEYDKIYNRNNKDYIRYRDFIRKKKKIKISDLTPFRISCLYAATIRQIHSARKNNFDIEWLREFQMLLFLEAMNFKIDLSWIHKRYKDIDL